MNPAQVMPAILARNHIALIVDFFKPPMFAELLGQGIIGAFHRRDAKPTARLSDAFWHRKDRQFDVLRVTFWKTIA